MSRIAKVRMEHIWVEAAIDFLPSRGAVLHSADTWLPLDASYKQYEFLEGLDLAQIADLIASLSREDLLRIYSIIVDTTI